MLACADSAPGPTPCLLFWCAPGAFSPQVAVCLGYTTKTKNKARQGVYGVKGQSPLFNHLIPSLCNTLSPGFRYSLWLGYDHDDPVLSIPVGASSQQRAWCRGAGGVQRRRSGADAALDGVLAAGRGGPDAAGHQGDRGAGLRPGDAHDPRGLWRPPHLGAGQAQAQSQAQAQLPLNMPLIHNSTGRLLLTWRRLKPQSHLTKPAADVPAHRGLPAASLPAIPQPAKAACGAPPAVRGAESGAGQRGGERWLLP